MNVNLAIRLLSVFAVTSALAALLTRTVRSVVLSRGWIKAPAENRWNRNPTPLYGGVAIVLAFFAMAAALQLWRSPEFTILILPSLGVFFVGVLDDAINLSPRTKFAAQLAAAAFVAYEGLRLTLTGNGMIDLSLTLLWIVGITNAFNLIDNMNGLCGGIAITTAVIRSLLFVHDGNMAGALLCVALAGSVLGFLFFNFPHAKIFMGDGGSLFLGFWLGSIALTNLRSFANNYLALLLFPLLAMLVPISDTLLVTFTRKLQGRPVSVGGKDHFSHRLVAYGLSERSAVLVLWMLSALSGGLALLMSVSGVSTWFTVAALVVVGAATLSAYLTRFEPNRASGISVPYRFRVVLCVALDCVLAIVAYYSALVIRYEGVPPRTAAAMLVAEVAVVCVVKIAMLGAARSYRQRIRYFGMEDAIRVGCGSAAATLACAVIGKLALPEGTVSTSVLVTDFLLFSALAIGFRSSFRVFDHLAPERALPRVLVHGGHERAELALKLLQAEYKVIGFLEDDPSAKHQCIRSIPVLGCNADLVMIAATRTVDLVVTTCTKPEQLRGIRQICAACDIPVYRLRLDLELVSESETGLANSKRKRVKRTSEPAANPPAAA